jgi:hypothetical protein
MRSFLTQKYLGSIPATICISSEAYKDLEKSVKEKEKSECGRCVRADFFAHLWGVMGAEALRSS